MSLVPVQTTPRDRIFAFEDEVMRKHEPVEVPIRHYFSDGVYAREMVVPKGVLLTGKIHKYTQLNMLLSGDVSVLLDDGWVRVRAPYTTVQAPGAKRMFYAHEVSVWTVILRTEETDVEKIEACFVAETEADYKRFIGAAEKLKELA